MDTWFPTFRRFVIGPTSFRAWWLWYTGPARRRALLRLIAVATEEHLPLAPLVEEWMEDERGVQRRRVRKLAQLLRQGTPLAAAVEEVPGVLREEDLLAIRFDAQTGTRTAAVRELLAVPLEDATNPAPRLWHSLIYFAVIVGIGLLLIAFTQLKIIPVLARIFSDFNVAMPPALAWSESSRGTLFGAWWLGLFVVIALAWWLLATRSGRPARRALFGRLRGHWHEAYAADVLQKLGIAVAAGRPIPGALATLARYHFDPAIRHELLFVRNEVELGADVWRSLAGVGMLSEPEVHLLHGSERTANSAWVLRQLAAAKQRRTSQRVQRAAEFVLPALVLLAAGLVVFQALTVFQPLTRIIDHLL